VLSEVFQSLWTCSALENCHHVPCEEGKDKAVPRPLRAAQGMWLPLLVECDSSTPAHLGKVVLGGGVKCLSQVVTS
jgi:hypothetical protein